MIYLTMFIFLNEGKESVFHEFENLALPILVDYNGVLIYRIRPTKESILHAVAEDPYEVHFISFETEQDFVNFSKDERRKAFLHLKEESIRTSFLIKGVKP